MYDDETDHAHQAVNQIVDPFDCEDFWGEIFKKLEKHIGVKIVVKWETLRKERTLSSNAHGRCRGEPIRQCAHNLLAQFLYPCKLDYLAHGDRITVSTAEDIEAMKKAVATPAQSWGVFEMSSSQTPHMGSITLEAGISGKRKTDSGGYRTVAELAQDYGTDPEATRKALDRWRRQNLGSDGFVEVSDRRPNEPQYLYSPRVVAPVTEELQRRSEGRELRRTNASDERPAK